MKKSRASYLFRHKAKLAVMLSWIGGFTNVISFMEFKGVFTSHITGSVTHVGRHFADGEYSDAAFFASLVFMFFCGAMTSSLLLEAARRRGYLSRFVLPFAAEAFLLATFLGVVAFNKKSGESPYLVTLVSFAMGLQNATITRISNAVVRSTHLTGVLTDLGTGVVHFASWYSRKLFLRPSARRWARLLKVSRRQESAQYILVLMGIFCSFFMGVLLGTMFYGFVAHWALLMPIGFLLMLVANDLSHPLADIKPVNAAADAELSLHGIIPADLPPEIGIYRIGARKGQNRAPDFQMWIDGLSPASRIVILTLSPVVEIDANAILDLDLAVRALSARGTKFILGGVSPQQYTMLKKLKFVQSIGAENIFPDLEFSIALGMQLARESHRTGAPAH